MATRKTVAFESYTITRDETNRIIVTKNGEVQNNAKGALREIASKCDFETDKTWTTQQFGSKLIAFIENNNSTLDSYDYTEDAGNGLIYIKKNGKWGFANTDGVVLAEPKFDMLGDEFVDGMIVTGQNGLHGFFSAVGGEVVLPIYKSVTDFKNGMAKVVTLDGEMFTIGKNGNRLDESDTPQTSVDAMISSCVVKIFGADLLYKNKSKLPDCIDLNARPVVSIISLLDLLKGDIEKQHKLYLLIATIYKLTDKRCDSAICLLYVMQFYFRWNLLQSEGKAEDDEDYFNVGEYAYHLLCNSGLGAVSYAQGNTAVTWNDVEKLLGRDDFEKFWDDMKKDDIYFLDEYMFSADEDTIDEEFEDYAISELSERWLCDWRMVTKDMLEDYRDDGLYYTSIYENLYFYIVDGQEVFSYE